MKKTDWNEGLNHVNADLVEEFVSKREGLQKAGRMRKTVIRTGALAACILLLISAAALPLLRSMGVWGSSEPSDVNGIPITQKYAPSPEPKHYGSEEASIQRIFAGDIIPNAVSVSARLKEVLPDTYTFYNDWAQTNFRLLRMETVDLIDGKEITEEFLYIVPLDYMTDFTVYSTFVFRGMRQRSLEYCVLYNTTRSCPESLDLLVFGPLYYEPENWNQFYPTDLFKVFDENGMLDRTLWRSTEAWQKATARDYDQYEGHTLSEEKQEKWNFDLGIDRLSSFKEESKLAVEIIKSRKQELYIPHYESHRISAVRYINGFATNQLVTISKDSVSIAEAFFEERDLSKLPDLTSARIAVIQALEQGRITPPHIKIDKESSKVINGIFCWYAKTETEILGVIRIDWRYTADSHSYFDDAYYIIEYGSSLCKPIDRDSLLERIGEYDEAGFIYKDNYGNRGKEPEFIS